MLKQMMLMTLWCLMMTTVICEPPRMLHHHHHRAPLIFKSWPPRAAVHSYQPQRSSGGMLMQLRGAGSSNVFTRASVPNMFIKSHNPIQFAMPMRHLSRPSLGSLSSAPSTHVYFKTGVPKKPTYGASLTSSTPVFKYSSPGGHKTAIKFKSPPPLKTKPEFIFEKVTVPKFADPIIANEAAIHQIAAPNLSLNQLDNDLTKTSIQAFGSALEKPIHHYQVQEHSNNDLTIKNSLTGQKSFFAPDNDPSLRTSPIKQNYDSHINSPSDGKLKPSDVLYHQNIEFNASPLVQQHFAVDPFQFPVTAQPQLQQYHLQQNAMTNYGMPLAAYNPTYLVQMSNSLLGQHQQHLTSQLFSPAQGYIDTSALVHHPQTHSSSSPLDKHNYEVASLGQIVTAQQHVDHQLNGILTSTLAPTTISDFFPHDFSAASHNVPSIAQLPDPKPNAYSYSQNFIDLPDEHSSSHGGYQNNLINYDEAYQRQVENDLILKEAHENLQGKLERQQQREAVAFDLHQHALAEQFNPLRIIVPDEDTEFKKRIDDDETYLDDDESEDDEVEEKSNEDA